MARPPDRARRDQLVKDAVDYAISHGVADLTLRPLAKALGVQPNTLVHHFGTKERLIEEILSGVRDRLEAMRAQIEPEVEADQVREVWSWIASPARQSFFRCFFEAYGLALRQPDRHRAFLDRVVNDWIDARASAADTLELAVIRGLLLDLLTTGDRERVEAALARYVELRTQPAQSSQPNTNERQLGSSRL